MIPWELLDSAPVPGGRETVTLHQRGHEYHIKVDGHLLMSNLTHSSEIDLAELGCGLIKSVKAPSVLVGGLGMGFTLRAALDRVGPQGKVYVSELLPAVVEWNRGVLAPLAGNPLADPRSVVVLQDIAHILRTRRGAYDAILQDVDNGPEGLTMQANDWLYSDEGLAAAVGALRPNGVLALWSAKPNKHFVTRMRKAGFRVAEHPVRGYKGRGAHHIVWTACL